jgi:poly(glycerol-phosphate) alpha-glucosyltransferase
MAESAKGLTAGIDAAPGWHSSVLSAADAYSRHDLRAWGSADVSLCARSRLGAPFTAQTLSRAILAASPAVLHIHGIWGLASIAGHRAIAKRGRSLLFVVSPHGMLDTWALARSPLKKAVAWRLWVGDLVARAACMHALCEPEARSIAVAAPGSRICVIPNGVDLPDPQKLVGPRDNSVLFLGRIHPKKGVAELLRGWAKSALPRAGWRLDVAGWGDEAYIGRLRAQTAELGLGESVRFVGPAFGDAKDALFRRAGAFVLPSFSEGLPMAILEAWSYQVPVLMSDECNLAAGFEAGAAVRCAPEPESIASALDGLMKESDVSALRDMGARGRSLAETSFSWPIVSRRMVDVYEWLCRGGEASEAPSTLFRG